MHQHRTLLVTAVALIAVGCGDGPAGCTQSIEPAIILAVTDAFSGAPLMEGVSGTLTEGEYSDSLRPWGANTVAGAFERPGTYAVWVEHPGYQPSTFVAPPVVGGQCHVETQRLQVHLVPVPG